MSAADKKAEGVDAGDAAADRFDVLVRARTEKKKLSTVVPAAELLKFQASLANIIKVNATNLKRKVREKKRKTDAAPAGKSEAAPAV